jgi:hypothetical protein
VATLRLTDDGRIFIEGPTLEDVYSKLLVLITMGADMSAELDRLTTEVSETKTVVDSAITLLGGLSQQIRDLKDDPAKLSALADDLDAKTNALAAAVAENTTPPA